MDLAKDAFTLPDGTITMDGGIAAEQWAEAFYKVKDALSRLRPVPEALLRGAPVKDLDEVLAECDSVLLLGDK